MKRTIFITAIALFLLGFVTDDTNVASNVENDRLGDTVRIRVPHNIDSITKVYADSINLALVRQSIPTFLHNECFDYDLAYVKHLHDERSLRMLIVNQINNIESLQWILSTKSSRMKDKCKLSSDVTKIEYFDKSWYDLLNERLYSLTK